MIIPGFNKYNIETDGVVTNVTTGRVIKPVVVTVKNHKYCQIALRDNDGNVCRHNVLALLALAYLDKPLHDGVVTAKDGNNLNTTLDNVAYTTRSEVVKRAWQSGGLKNRRKRGRCYDDSSIAMVYEALQAYDTPVHMTTLSNDLAVPYATIRYSIQELCYAGKVHKTDSGFEVIK